MSFSPVLVNGYGHSKSVSDFSLNDDNRNIVDEAVDEIADSIRKTGIIIPIFCYKNESNKLEIIDGQHRFTAWKKYFKDTMWLNYTYTTNKTGIDSTKIQMINKTRNTWKINDYIENRAKKGDVRAITSLDLKGYRKSGNRYEQQNRTLDMCNRLNLAQIISLFHNQFKNSTVWQNSFIEMPINKNSLTKKDMALPKTVNKMADDVIILLFDGINKTH